jgi:hypothetical protein
MYILHARFELKGKEKEKVPFLLERFLQVERK